jgi:hypothetical protein
MAAGWYCKVMGQVLGPMPLQQVMDLAREGTLKPQDMVRKKTGEWVVGSDIRGLFAPASEARPPLVNVSPPDINSADATAADTASIGKSNPQPAS